MEKKSSKIVWGVFFLGLGLMWMGSSFGLIRHGAFSGLLVSFILVLSGISIILKGNHGTGASDKAIEDNSDEETYREDYVKEDYRKEESVKEKSEEENNEAIDDEAVNDESLNGEAENNRREYNDWTDTSGNSYTGYGEPKSAKASSGRKNYTSILASNKIQCTDEFTGAEITALAGALELDLRNAVITRDIVIDVNCFWGGITIFLPSGVEVSVSCIPIMGGVESKINGNSNRKEKKATLYISGTCIMGGIEIR